MGAEKEDAQGPRKPGSGVALLVRLGRLCRCCHTGIQRVTSGSKQGVQSVNIQLIVDIACIGATASVAQDAYRSQLLQMIRDRVWRQADQCPNLTSPLVGQCEEPHNSLPRLIGEQTQKSPAI